MCAQGSASLAVKPKLVWLFWLALAAVSLGQVTPTGSVEGVVKDPSGAVLPGVNITLINVETGLSRSTISNDLGYYTFSAVQPGRYRIQAELQGFQKFVQEFRVQTAIKATVDIQLQLGEVQQTIQVTAEAPMLETGSASLSTLITNRQVTDLPLAGRNPYQLILLSAGVIQTSNPGPSNMADVSSSSYFSTNGANMRMNDFLMDGVPNNIADRVAYIPPVEQVEEFNVQTNTFDAEFGHAGGAVINVTTRSGTNSFHGSIYEFLRNSALNANNFFNNQRGLGKPSFRYNQFGAAAGGPLVRNRTFWFFNYEGIRTSRPFPGIGTVPTALQRNGDFSQTFDQRGSLIRIYDPFSTRPDPNNPGRFVRDPFPSNVIPATRIDPVARNLLALVPLPNSPGDPITGTNNYVKTLTQEMPMNDFSVRVDHELTRRNHLFARWSQAKTVTRTDYLIDVGGKNINNRVQTSIGLGNTFTISPTTMLHISAGFTRWTQEGIQPDADLSKFGFPTSFIRELQQQKIPVLNNSDMSFFGAIEGSWFEHTNTYAFQVNMRHMRGRHSMKWGFQTQVKQNNSIPARQPSGRFSFDRGFTQGPDPTLRGSNIGHGIASFLLGTPASGNVSLRVDNAGQSPYYGVYFQDDIRVTQKLTLNVGLRYEIMLPSTERFDRQVIGFAYDTPNPIEEAARTAYARNPIPELPADRFRVLGGLLFASPSNRRSGRIDKTNLGPLLGIAYRLTDKTVFRAGFGIFYTYWWSPFVRQTGFDSETPFVATLDGITPANRLSDPFPNGLVRPPGSSQGLATLLGTSVSFYDQFREQPYNERWSVGFQRELSRDLRLEVNYVGQTAFRLPVGSAGQGVTPAPAGEQDRELRFLSAEYLSLRSRLFQTVPNPFFGLIPSGPLSARTISIQNLLSTYPQFTSVIATRQTFGNSYYHSLQVTATKRFSEGYQFLSAYTFSKSLERLRFINVSDPGPSKMVGDFDRPHRFTFAGVFELPFGPGRRWGNRGGAVGKLISGWQLNLIQTFQSGEALPILTNVVPTGEDPRLDPSRRSVDGWFNRAAFAPLPEFALRTLPFRISRLRGDAINNWDMSLLKDTMVRENLKVQFRWELFNAFNRPQFGAPNLDPRSGAYGRITSQANTPRDMQFALKIMF